eukprot:3433416-Amphidinium_carterae.1
MPPWTPGSWRWPVLLVLPASQLFMQQNLMLFDSIGKSKHFLEHLANRQRSKHNPQRYILPLNCLGQRHNSGCTVRRCCYKCRAPHSAAVVGAEILPGFWQPVAGSRTDAYTVPAAKLHFEIFPSRQTYELRKLTANQRMPTQVGDQSGAGSVRPKVTLN